MNIHSLPISNAIQIDTQKEGPEILLLAGIHGNEKSGVYAVERFLFECINSQHTLLKGKINIILGNEEALEANKRYIKVDMNRCFFEDTSHLPEGYERERVEILKPYLASCDFALDLHSCTSESEPFVASYEHDTKSAKLLGAKHIITGWEHLSPMEGVTNAYIENHGGKSFTFEAGQHDDPYSVTRAYETLLRFLQFTGVLEGKEPLNADSKTRVYKFYYIESKAEGHTYFYPRNYHNFHDIREGETVMQSSKGNLVADKNCVMIFPVPPERAQVGEEMFFLADIVE